MDYQDAKIALEEIIKGNDKTLTGLIIRKDDETVAPSIYLEHYEEQFSKGRPMDDIMKEIAQIKMENSLELPIDVKGLKVALKLTKGNHAFVVCTHVDKHHVHNHIIINSTTLDCQKKFRNFWGSTWAIRRMNDKLCLEHGLSIVENSKPSRDHYGTWMGSQKQPSHQEQLR